MSTAYAIVSHFVRDVIFTYGNTLQAYNSIHPEIEPIMKEKR